MSLQYVKCVCTVERESAEFTGGTMHGLLQRMASLDVVCVFVSLYLTSSTTNDKCCLLI